MEMEKRLILAVVLSIVIYAAFMWLFPPPKREPTPPAPTQTVATEEPQRREPLPGETQPSEEEQPAPEVEAERIAAAEEQEVRIDNGVFDVVFTNRGGQPRSWLLRDYVTTSDGEPLELIPKYESGDDGEVLPLAIDPGDPVLAGELNQALYRVDRESVPSEGERTGGERLTFTWADGTGLEARKTFVFRRGSYLVDVRLDVTDRGRRRSAGLAIGPGFAAQESSEGHSNYYYDSQAVWNVAGEVTRRRPRKLSDQGGFAGNVYWAGLEDQYFTALLLPSAPESQVGWRKVELVPVPLEGEQTEEPPKVESKPVLVTSIPEAGAQLFIGPKKYGLLKTLGREMDEAVWFSSMDWLRPIVKYLFVGLVWIHDHVTRNWGWSIVLATLVLRLVLFPINQYSMVSMKKSQLQMQRLQPKVKAIRSKYKKAKDAQARAKMNQEMMEMYKREGVNPMGGLSGCLPLLAQFPILIGFYNMLTVAVELRGAPFFGWIRDLSQADPFYITPILMAVTMFAQQKLAMSRVKDPQQLQQQRIMMFMPLVFGYFCLWLPSGLVLYWFVNNLLGMGQQWLVNRHTGRLEAAAQKA